jgi:lipopolysaccharide export system permease protein
VRRRRRSDAASRPALIESVVKITSKYVLREHLGPLTFALGALTSLLLLNYIARKFGDLVGKGLPWTVVMEFMLLSVPFTFAMTLPMAVLVSTLYAFSRLASENEITAFKASGVGMSRLLGPVLLGATALAGVMIYFNDQVLPASNHRLSTLTQNIGRTSPTFLLKERVLNEIGTDGLLLSATTIDRARNRMHDVTIYDFTETTPRTVRADSGEFSFLPNKRDLQLTLYDGTVTQLGEQKPEQLQRTEFKTQLSRYRDILKSFDSSGDAQNSYKSDREMSICELQRAYLQSRKEWLLANYELQGAIADSLKRKRPGKPKPGRVFLGVGQLYCQAIAAVGKLGVRTAKAQQPPVLAQQDTVRRDSVRADSARRDSVRRDSARAAAVAPKPAAPTPVPAPTPAPARDSAPPETIYRQPVPPPLPSPPPGVPQSIPPRGSIAVPAVPGVAGVPTPPVLPLDTSNRAALPTLPPSAGGGDPYAFGASGIALARAHVKETLGTMNNYDVEIHKKFALAVACIVFVLLGAPIALRFPSGGVGLVIGASLLVFATYYSFLIAGENLAGRGMLPPWIAMWGANVLFTAVGLPLALRMGKHAGSNRGGGFGEMLDNLRFRWNARRPAVVTPPQAT